MSTSKLFVAERTFFGCGIFVMQTITCLFTFCLLAFAESLKFFFSKAKVTVKAPLPQMLVYYRMTAIIPLMQVLLSVAIMSRPWILFKAKKRHMLIYAWVILTASSTIVNFAWDMLTLEYLQANLPHFTQAADLSPEMQLHLLEAFTIDMRVQIQSWIVTIPVLALILSMQLMAMLTAHGHSKYERSLKYFRPFVARSVDEYKGTFVVSDIEQANGALPAPKSPYPAVHYLAPAAQKGHIFNAFSTAQQSMRSA